MSDQALLELLDRIDDLELDEYLHLDDYKCIEIVKKQAKEIRTRMAAPQPNIEVPKCITCKYRNLDDYKEPCKSCWIDEIKWEPKEEKKEGN